MNQSITSLMEFGLTQLEAEIYVFLIGNSPATGYKISQSIGKPTANVYKAIQTLEPKGAILVDEDKSRLCRAIPPKEFLDSLQRNFNEKRKSTEDLLSRINQNDNDDRVYQLKSVDQVLERCRKMLERGENIIVIDAFPKILEKLRLEIEAIAKSGVSVAVNSYKPIELQNVEVFYNEKGEETISRWPGQWVNIVVDGNEHLLAFLSNDLKEVIQAIWSGSPYISWVYYSAVYAELELANLKKMINDGNTIEELKSKIVYWDKFFVLDALGYKNLLERFGIKTGG